MGLDLVELHMEWEKEFHCKLPLDEFHNWNDERMRSGEVSYEPDVQVGRFAEWVAHWLSRFAPDQNHDVLSRVIKCIHSTMNIPPDEISSTSYFYRDLRID